MGAVLPVLISAAGVGATLHASEQQAKAMREQRRMAEAEANRAKMRTTDLAAKQQMEASKTAPVRTPQDSMNQATNVLAQQANLQNYQPNLTIKEEDILRLLNDPEELSKLIQYTFMQRSQR